MTSLDYVAMAAVIILGVPHGGLDGAVARRIGWPTTASAWLSFHLSYIALAAAVAGFWWWFPSVSLGLFLLISGLHFGLNDSRHLQSSDRNCALPIAAHGGLAAIAIPGFQSEAVLPMFTLLAGEAGAETLSQLIDFALFPYLLVVIIFAAKSIKEEQWRLSVVTLFIFLALAYALPPLISFALYFCLWHSRIHMFRTWQSIASPDRLRSLLEALIYSVAAWSVAALIYWFFSMELDSALLQLTFIGLAALTVPHMLLVDLAESKTKGSSL